MTNLTSLSIRRSPALTDKSLETVKRLPKLVDLGLLDLGITDDGLKQVAQLAGLRRSISAAIRNCPTRVCSGCSSSRV